MTKLLPPDFDKRVERAIQRFWAGRLRQGAASQEGGRGSVIGGKNLDGFAELIRDVALFCGLSPNDIVISGKARLTIPGYFRPTKMWDALAVYKGHLIAAFELKSQVGPSFGNNFNNRSEESIGSATDFWTAHRENAFESLDENLRVEKGRSTKPPFLGFLMLLEETARSISDVRVDEAHFKVFPEFTNASYAKRYELLIERLVAEQLYSAGCLLLSEQKKGSKSGAYTSPTVGLNPRALFASFAGALLAARETYRDG